MLASLFILTLSLSSFLLFQVQPIISKYILPWYGGTSAVWITAMLFFQVVLLLGYAYVFVLRKYSIQKQVLIHLLLLSVIGSLVLLLFYYWQVPILPGMEWKLSENIYPAFQIIIILSIGVGVPYFLLSTTSIILQKWFSTVREGESPYLFYAFSNAASLIAILSYPFVIEPFLSIKTQGLLWSIGFIVYIALLLFSCVSVLFFMKNRSHPKHMKASALSYHLPTKKKIALWFVLSFSATLMLLSITAVLTQSIAPVPFLWLLPLSLYLLSFIISFSGERWYPRNAVAYLFLLTMPWALLFLLIGTPSTIIGALIYGTVLFTACLLSNGELYHSRPHPHALDIFYFVIALGSAVGGIFVGLVAPVIFDWVWELYLGFYFSFVIAMIALLYYKRSLLYRWSTIFFASQKERYLFVAIGFPVVFISAFFAIIVVKHVDSIQTWRSFYSILTVEEKHHGKETLSYLKHGNIVHGAQYNSEKRRYIPTTYFTTKSGVGKVFETYPRPDRGLRAGLVGLGIGTLATYGKPGDTFIFYEIDPQVVSIAQTKFTYLKDSEATISIRVGDGRLSLEKELSQHEPPFDLLVLDAFSGDSIPIHLLTKEAFAMYLKRLVPNGVLLIHISNNYLDLKPPLRALAEYNHIPCLFLYAPATDDSLASEWAVFTHNKVILTNSDILKMQKDEKKKTVQLWTDDYSNLFQILK
jgi:hypothetical protein